MILAAPALAATLLLAQAVTLLPDPVEMGERSGRVLGAAAACGVSAKRVEAVRRTSLELIGQAGFTRDELRQARHAHDRAMREARQATRPADCPPAVAAFGQAERF